MNCYPYPGLRPFRRDESYLFFGRDAQIDQLLANLERCRFLAIVGVSGCGKSSLAKAGMMAALETGYLGSAGARWRIAEMRPGGSPFKNLSVSLVERAALGPERGQDSHSAAFMQAALRRGPLGLVEIFRETSLPAKTNLLVLVDQFEEIFDFCRNGGLDEAQAFVSLLLTASESGLPIYVVLTMRSDYLGNCSLFAGLPEALNQSQFLTPRLSREECREAIEKPARVFDGMVQSALVNRLLNDMGPDPDQLPLMQHVLMRMWTCALQRSIHLSGNDQACEAGSEPREITLELKDYVEAGGLDEALSRHADEAYNELDGEQQHTAEILFKSLCQRGGQSRETRRRVNLSTVAEVAQVPPESLRNVIEVFRRSDRNFIVCSPETDPDPILDISHESLIRNWKKFNRWATEEEESAATYRRLEDQAIRWQQGRADLLGSLELAQDRVWQEREQPNKLWSKRYGVHFDLVMEFLRQSKRRRMLWRLSLSIAIVFACALTYLIKVASEHEREAADSVHHQVQDAAKFAMTEPGLGLWLAADAHQRRESPETMGVLSVALNEAQRARIRSDYHHTRPIESVSFNQEENRIVTVGRDHKVKIWGIFSDERPLELPVIGKVLKADFLDAFRLAIAKSDGTIQYWNTDITKGIQGFRVDQELVLLLGKESQSLVLSPNGRVAVSLVVDRNSMTGEGKKDLLMPAFLTRVELWDTQSGKQLPISIPPLPGFVQNVSFHPAGTHIAVVNADGIITVASTQPPFAQGTVSTGEKTYALAFLSQENRLVTGGSDRVVKVWDSNTGRPIRRLSVHSGPIMSIAASPRGTWIASGDTNGNIKLWNNHVGREQLSIDSTRKGVSYLAFSPGEKYLASTNSDETFSLYPLAGEHLQAHVSELLKSSSFSPSKDVCERYLSRTSCPNLLEYEHVASSAIWPK